MGYVKNPESDISPLKSQDREAAESINDLFDKPGVAILTTINRTSLTTALDSCIMR